MWNMSTILSDKPKSSFCRITEESTDKSYYDALYSIHEEYYDRLLKSYSNFLLSEAKNKDISKVPPHVFSNVLDWLIPVSYKFLHYVSNHSRILIVELRTIERYMKKDEKYPYRKYSISDIGYEVESLPDTTGKLPDWYKNNTTVERMVKYLKTTLNPVIKSGDYRVAQLVPKIKNYAEQSSAYFRQTNKRVEEEKLKLDKLSKTKKEDYIQLGVYQRASMMIYTESAEKIANLIHNMFDDIQDPVLKQHAFDDFYETHASLVQGLEKDLI